MWKDATVVQFRVLVRESLGGPGKYHENPQSE